MNADHFTSPEHSAQIRQAKRYRAAIKKRGVCSACVHREQSFGVYHCRNAPDRQHPQCERDGKPARFTFDDSTLGEFADAA